jgi:hypothetical protein
MGANLDAFSGNSLHCCKVFADPVPAVDSSENLVIHRLQAEFQADVTAPGDFLKKFDRFVRQAIRTGSHGDADDVGMGKYAPVQVAYFVQRAVGVGMLLKVNNEFFAAEGWRWKAIPSAICFSTEIVSSVPRGEKELLLQKMQPPVPLTPSRFGQVKPPSTLTLLTRQWNRRRRYEP